LVAVIGSVAGYGILSAFASDFVTGSDTLSSYGEAYATAPCGSGTTLDCAIKRANADALAKLEAYCDFWKTYVNTCDDDCDPYVNIGHFLDESTVTYETVSKTPRSAGGVKVTVKATGKCYCWCQRP
jgi:hypothetical protein